MKLKNFNTSIYFGCIQIENLDTNKKLVSSGTAFIFYDEGKGFQKYFLVTNKHVIRGASTNRITFLNSVDRKSKMEERIVMDLEQTGSGGWLLHPDPNVDIAIIDVTGLFVKANKENSNPYFYAINREFFISNKDFFKLGGIGKILFVGYPSGLKDTRHNLPIVRSGITATPPFVNFNGLKKFLIDASVFEGSSGSPVFWVSDIGHQEQEIFFIGIVSAAHVDWKRGDIIEAKDESNNQIIEYATYLNLGIVEKAQPLLELLDLYWETCIITS